MEWTKIQVLIGTVDYTGWLAAQEQVATLPDGPEIGRASFTLLDDGTMPAISDWSAITLKGGGTAATVNLWAGYVTRQQSEPFSMTAGAKRLVTLDCQSAAVRLLTAAPVTAVYGGGDQELIIYDRDIVADLVSTYAPALYNVAKIGTAAQVQIEYIGFRNESLRSALNKISERTGRVFGVDSVPEFWYREPNSIDDGYVAYGYKLTDAESIWTVNNDYLPMTAKPVYDRDATGLRNSVRVLGGSTLSTVQEETFAGDDVTTVFQVDYTPDVVISVEVGGVAQTVGIYYVDDPADFDCLVEYDRRQFHFDTAPSSGKNVVIQYRYKTRIDLTVTDAASIAAVGTIWAPVLEDGSVSSASQGSALGSAYLASTQATTRATLTTRHGGTAGTSMPWEPGRTFLVSTEAFGWDEEELRIRGVTMRMQPRAEGDGSCIIIWDLDVGSGLASAGRIFGAQWNNVEVLPKQMAPDNIERLGVEASGGVSDHGGLTGLADDDHTQYLLATGARTGASSQAQAFTNGIIGPTWKPAADSTTALQLQNAAGTAVASMDTSNGRLYVPSPSAATRAYLGTDGLYITTNTGTSVNSVKMSSLDLRFDARQVARFYNNGTQWFYGSSTEVKFTASSIQFEDGTGGVTMVGAVMRGANHLGVQALDNRFTVTITQNANASGTANVLNVKTQAGAAAIGVKSSGETGIGTLTPDSQLHVELADSATSAASQLLTLSHNSSGTPAAGYGSRVLFELESSTTADQTAAALDVVWNEATHASRKADVIWYAYDTAARECLRLRGNGSAAAIGFLGATPAARQAHVADASTAHAITAPADSPASADALRDDLTTNVLPSIETALNNLGTKINSLLTMAETFGFHATS